MAAGTVSSIEINERRLAPLALFDLLALQPEANRRFAYSAAATLQIAQTFYEDKKVITYPRTESRHLSTDMAANAPAAASIVSLGAEARRGRSVGNGLWEVEVEILKDKAFGQGGIRVEVCVGLPGCCSSSSLF